MIVAYKCCFDRSAPDRITFEELRAGGSMLLSAGAAGFLSTLTVARAANCEQIWKHKWSGEPGLSGLKGAANASPRAPLSSSSA